MVTAIQDQEPGSSSGPGDRDGRLVVRKAIVALAIVLFAQAMFALCLISAHQLSGPRDMPFGVVGSSQVVAQAQTRASLQLISYPNSSAVLAAIDRGELYGAYVAGAVSDTVIVVPSMSFSASGTLADTFVSAAHALGRPVTVRTAKPLPPSDPVGAVVSLLLLPLLIGGYLGAVLVFKAAGGRAAGPWRLLVLTGYAVLGAVVTDLVAGPLLGAYSGTHFWSLLPCFILVNAAVALATASILGLLGSLGVLVVAVLFIMVGGAGAGTSGTYLLPVYWRNIGVLLPPQNAVNLIRNVLYFDANNIRTPLTVLFLYVIASVLAMVYLGRIRPARRAHSTDAVGSAGASQDATESGARPERAMPLVLAVGICLVMIFLFALNYMSAQRAPTATDLPFGTIGQSPILTEARQRMSLSVNQYSDETAVKSAIDQAQIWGALIPAARPQTPSTLIVVPSISSLAPLDLTKTFEQSARNVGQPLTVEPYTPTPLAPKDPRGVVPSLMMLSILIGGYVSASVLLTATGRAAGPWRTVYLVPFAAVSGLVVDLVAGLWLGGYPSGKFWIVWPICSLVVAVMACIAVILQKLVGAIGTLLTVVVVVLFGNPSSGGSVGTPFLPTFWRDIGAYLPTRNGYLLLQRTICFDGHGTTAALVVLLSYLLVSLTILVLLDRFRGEARVRTDTTEAAAVTVPIGSTP
jgi:hypothetical protein